MHLEKIDNAATMSSREIAQLTGKEHYNVIRDIKNQEEPYYQVFGNALKFEVVKYRDLKGEEDRIYLFFLFGCLDFLA